MSFPEAVIVCGVTYSVELVEDGMDFEEEYGMINYAQRRIRIQDNGDPVVNMQTLVHEIMHAISNAYGLKLDNTEKKHQAMDVLASVLVDTLTRSDILVLD